MLAQTKKWFTVVALVATAVIGGCKETSDLEWSRERSSAKIDGKFLTRDPDNITYPVKIVFAIDSSLSMGEETPDGQLRGSDPNFQRIIAVENFINEFNQLPNVSFDLMFWADNVFLRTTNEDNENGFTKNQSDLNTIIQTAKAYGSQAQTNYLGTLTEIKADIQNDIQNQGVNDLKRSKYIVVFLSDGQPLNNGVVQDRDQIVARVQEIKEVAELGKVGSFAFHTYLLDAFGPGDAEQAARNDAIETLTAMSIAGEGNNYTLKNAESISFLSTVDLRLAVEYLVDYLIAYNINTVPGTDDIHLDSDGDGLTDEEELIYGSYPWCRDSDNDGASDYVEYRLTTPTQIFNPLTGIVDWDGDGPLDINDPDNNCTPGVNGTWPDTDGDLLNDCEESMIGTDRREPDTDKDGIPDGLEFLAGTNHLQPEETTDSDIDGVMNPVEIRNHTNVTSDDRKLQERYAYQYFMEDKGMYKINQGENGNIVESIRKLFTLDVENIDLLEVGINPRTNKPYEITGDCQDYVRGENRIYVYLSEVAADDPTGSSFVSKTEFKVNIDSDKNPSGDKIMELHSNGLDSEAGIYSQALEELNYY